MNPVILDEGLDRTASRLRQPLSDLAHLGLTIAVLAMFGCGLGEAHFQAGWRGWVRGTGKAVLDYSARNGGRLPASLEDLPPVPESQAPYRRWMHYRVVAPDRFLVWLERDDIIAGFQGQPDSSRISELPDKTDIFVEYSTDGVERSSSWESNFWNRI